jgi:hypothetical protein
MDNAPRLVAFKDDIETFLKTTGSAAGVIDSSSGATGSETQWVDWTTRTLN